MTVKQENSPNHLTTADPQKIDVGAEIAHIRKETRRLEVLMQSLPERRVTLLRQLNGLQSSTRAFPSEVLLRIFRHSIHSTADFELLGEGASYLPITLSSVCFKWHQIIYSTPQLWSTVRVDPRPMTLKSNIAILKLYFTNSRHIPLSLSVKVCHPDLLENENATEPEVFQRFFAEIYGPNAGRIRRFRIVNPSAQWVDRVSNIFSNLEHFWLESYSSSTNALPQLKFIPPPSLLCVTLCNVEAPITLSSDTITSLNLEQMPIITCLGLLAQCRNLIEYRSRGPTQQSISPTISGINPLKKGLALSCLKLFEWTCVPSHQSTEVLGHISLPALATFFLRSSHIQKDDAIPQLFLNLPPTLSTFGILMSSLHKSAVRHIFTNDSMQNLRTIYIIDCSVNFIRDLLLLLTPHWRDNKGIKYIPLLKLLVLENTNVTGNSDDEESALYAIDMVERRKLVGRDRRFCLRLINLSIDWDPRIQEKFQELVSGGLELVIEENSEPVDWLS